MKKFMIATAACVTLMSGAAFAQTTGPAGQQDTNKPGVANPQTDTTSGSMNNTTGMSKDGMSKGSMNNGAMNRGAESKDGDGMAKGGMKK